ncbi:MAG: hypothetical protein AVDCRST_MAG56-1494, partial [uncultured Cytophagales bacterium]
GKKDQKERRARYHPQHPDPGQRPAAGHQGQPHPAGRPGWRRGGSRPGRHLRLGEDAGGPGQRGPVGQGPGGQKRHQGGRQEKTRKQGGKGRRPAV